MPIGVSQSESGGGGPGGDVIVTNIRSSTSVKNRVIVPRQQPIELAAIDLDRVGFVLHNESGVLYVNCGTADASIEEYTYRLTANSTLENSIWQGRISAIKEDTASPVSLTIFKGV